MNLGGNENIRRRRRTELAARGSLMLAAAASIIILAILIVRLLADGLPAFSWNFWTLPFSPRGIRTGNSGIQDALISSIVMLSLTLLFAVPFGTAAGIYLHEIARDTRLTGWIRATVSNLAGVPSIVYGLLGLSVFVRGLSLGASNLAGALTLAVLILPILIVSTEEALKTVPASVRHASLALGATRWQTIRSHVLPYALPGILTGNILAMSRAAGETAPLLILGVPIFTSVLGYGPLDAGTPLQVRIYFLANDPRREAALMAAGAVVVLLLATLALNVVAIWLRQRLNNRIKW